MTLPNFLIIGAGKAGTTALYHYLRQHPQIFMSALKEPTFFAVEGETTLPRWADTVGKVRPPISTLAEYEQLFAAAGPGLCRGEASTVYLTSARAPERIKHHVPDAKLIAILRNPVERAYAAFLHGVRDGYEPLTDFAAALEAEEQRIRANWDFFYHYRQRGLYFRPLHRYLELFGRSQVRIFLYEEWRNDNLAILRDIFGYLGADQAFAPEVSRRYNRTGLPRSRRLAQWLRRVKPLLRSILPASVLHPLAARTQQWATYKPVLAPAVAAMLLEFYRTDILQLQELVQRDLSAWLQDGSARR